MEVVVLRYRWIRQKGIGTQTLTAYSVLRKSCREPADTIFYSESARRKLSTESIIGRYGGEMKLRAHLRGRH